MSWFRLRIWQWNLEPILQEASTHIRIGESQYTWHARPRQTSLLINSPDVEFSAPLDPGIREDLEIHKCCKCMNPEWMSGDWNSGSASKLGSFLAVDSAVGKAPSHFLTLAHCCNITSWSMEEPNHSSPANTPARKDGVQAAMGRNALKTVGNHGMIGPHCPSPRQQKKGGPPAHIGRLLGVKTSLQQDKTAPCVRTSILARSRASALSRVLLVHPCDYYCDP